MSSIKTVPDFFNKLAGDIDKTYFPDVKYYRDNKHTTKIHYAIELFNNGCLTYEKLIQRLTYHTRETRKKMHQKVFKYIEDFGSYKFKP